MSSTPQRLSRRRALQLGLGGLAASAAGGAVILRRSDGAPITVSAAAPALTAQVGPAANAVRVIATDGFMSYPGRRTRQGTAGSDTDGYGYDGDRDDGGEGVYSFGFRAAIDADTAGGDAFTAPIGELVDLYKGLVHHPSPILAFEKNVDVFLKMSNLGFQLRPDLADAHTLHWHGFRQAVAVFDGVPEVSVAVPPVRDFPYYYLPEDEGTYMYHCHFEDTEHVQMGMDGVVYVEAELGPDHLYEDPATRFDRQYTLLLNEVDLNPHDQLVGTQEFTWSDYDAHYYVMNGRCYPDTARGSGDPGVTSSPFSDGGDKLPLQPVSSLIQAVEGETIALRMANLGFYQHELQLAGIPMTVVGKDATLLEDGSGTSLAYTSNTVPISPGESRDALFVAPPHSGGAGPDIYIMKNRDTDRLVNGPGGNLSTGTGGANGAVAGLGGMATEIHVYPAGSGLPAQAEANGVFAETAPGVWTS